AHEALRRQQRLAAARHPRPQPDPELPARHPGGAEAAVPQANVCLPAPQSAHAAVSVHRPGGTPDSPRRPERAATYREPGDGGTVWADRSPPSRLIYLPFGVRMGPTGRGHGPDGGGAPMTRPPGEPNSLRDLERLIPGRPVDRRTALTALLGLAW